MADIDNSFETPAKKGWSSFYGSLATSDPDPMHIAAVPNSRLKEVKTSKQKPLVAPKDPGDLEAASFADYVNKQSK